MALCVLPLVVVGAWVVGQLGLGRLQHDVFYEGVLIVLVSMAIWLGWIVGVGVGAIWDWFSRRESAPHRG